MPELPETETIARDLDEMVRGAVFTGFLVAKPDVLRECDQQTFARVLVGAAISRVWRRAKLVVFDVAPPSPAVEQAVNSPAAGNRGGEAVAGPGKGGPEAWKVVIQPRFTGGVLVDDGTLAATELRYVAVTFELRDGRKLHYRDVRRLGTVALMSAARWAEYEGALGVEPLDDAVNDEQFSALIRASRVSIKQRLMHQPTLAGIGNIYANEALWMAQIDPSREAGKLTFDDSVRLREALSEVLTASIAARGTSFRDYRDARGERGKFVEQLKAYGRAGEACRRCGKTLIGTHAIDGRSTTFCYICQT